MTSIDDSRPNTTTLLIVEDNFDIRNMLVALLRDEHTIQAVADGQEALDTLQRVHIDLILTDIMMPNIDGIELTRFVRSEPSLSHIPVILLTALHRPDDVAKGLTAGANDYLKKPFSAIELRARINATLTTMQLNRELTVARDAAEASDQMKSRFLAQISHELRTPLNGIVGMLEQLQDTELTQRQTNCLSTIKSASDSLLHLFDQLIDVAQLSTDTPTLQLTDCNLRVLVKSIANLVQHSISDNRQKVSLSFSDDLPIHVKCDPGLLTQILTNIIGNAIKFTPEGEISIVLDVENESQNPDTIWLKFVISDTGIGIDPSVHDQIFERFTQGNEQITARYGGTGLGLAISKGLVSFMGGSISVESEVGAGSTFRVSIPASSASSRLANTEEEAGDSNCETDNPAVNARILVVEDRNVTQYILENAGHKVRLADTGIEALKVLASETIDLVLLDIQMPDMDGFETTRRIRCQEQFATLPIVAVTANAFKESKDACMKAGMDDYLAKPIHKTQLLNLINKWSPTTPMLSDREPLKAELEAHDEIISIERLKETLGNKMSLVKELLQVFDEDMQIQEEALRIALAEKDYDRIASIAHSLKGSSARVTAIQLSELSSLLEVRAQTGNSPVESLTEEVFVECARLRQWLRGLS